MKRYIYPLLVGLFLITVFFTTAQTDDPLAEGFNTPPNSAKPRVWWHWMNGNVTWEGAKEDMDWMNRVGIGGLMSFDAGRTTPQVVEVRLPYMTDGWKEVFANTAEYADQVGLELAVAASPGWSETGGPWVTAEDAMKKMAWSVTYVQGGQPFRGQLPQPPDTTGVFQTSTEGGVLGGREESQNPPTLYVDQRVVAFPLPENTELPEPTITASGGELDGEALYDGELEEVAIDLPAAERDGDISWIQFDYGEPVTIRGLNLGLDLYAGYYNGLEASQRGGTPQTRFRLESSDDGQTWTNTGAIIQTGKPMRTASVDNVTARYFRFVSEKLPPRGPHDVRRFERPSGPPPESIEFRELVLRGEATIHSFEEKAAFANNSWYYQLPSGSEGTYAALSSEVIDLTDQMSPDGSLDWTPPPGNWMVMRIGYSLTGAMNRPASPEATGLEVDKLDKEAVERYMETYLSLYEDAADGLIGERGLHAIMFDSWEASNTNWSPNILADFERLRGYDPTPWLPTLAGYVVDSPEKSDLFLFDWRRTIQQLVKENHYEFLTKYLHDRGMIRYGEAHEELYSTMGDGMEMKQSADIPMAAMWQVDTPGQIEPVYFNDNQESASVAHIYGQNISATESFTGGPAYASTPWTLKPTADAILLSGSNRFVIHTSTHQPVTRGPGMTLGVGQYFTRNETWAEQAKPWVDFLSRSSFMLQQGKSANDIAVFYGEASPVISNYRNSYPAVPGGYRYDYVNADVILNKLSVQDGKLFAPTGISYEALYFGNGTDKVTLPVLKKVLELVNAGAVLIGTRPEGSPSLADDADEVTAVLDQLWPGGAVNTVGSGRVFNSSETAGAISQIGLSPDFSYSKNDDETNVMFIHRALDMGDLYYVANRVDREETIEASFRVTGLKPELWDPITGEVSEATYEIGDERTQVTLPMKRFGSVFVVFREPTTMRSNNLPETTLANLVTLEGPWEVAFQEARGAPASATFETLMDFRDHENEGIKYFSGVATYTKEIALTGDQLESGQIWLDLGEVYYLAEVWVNGQVAGTAWSPPYRVDISDFVAEGENTIQIKAVNLWPNRMIGDEQPGVAEEDRITNRPSNRTFYRADSPLLPAGLLGPVQVLKEE